MKAFRFEFLTAATLLMMWLAFPSPQFLGQEIAGGNPRRKIIIDQDGAGPAGTDQQAILLLIQSPQTEVLGVTVVTGDAWLKEEVAHTLRALELIGRTDIAVVPGAELPLVRRKEETELWEQRYGYVAWLGAWTPKYYHPPDQWGNFPEGMPTTKPRDEDAAHFLVRMVRKFPHEVTIYEGGPMTNLALAMGLLSTGAGRWRLGPRLPRGLTAVSALVGTVMAAFSISQLLGAKPSPPVASKPEGATVEPSS